VRRVDLNSDPRDARHDNNPKTSQQVFKFSPINPSLTANDVYAAGVFLFFSPVTQMLTLLPVAGAVSLRLAQEQG